MKAQKTLWAALATWQFLVSPVAAADDTSPSTVLFQLRGQQSIRGGRYSEIAQFQENLIARAKQCNIDVASKKLVVDGTFGPATSALLTKVASCPTIAAKLARYDQARSGAISTGAWQVIAPNVSMPDALARAHTMTLSYEATDYGDIEFNLGTRDDGILTWGPLGATAGQARQVQAILRAVNQQSPELIDVAFGNEATSIRQLSEALAESDVEAIIQSVQASGSRTTAWQKGFATLGESKLVRDTYDSVMGDTGTSGIFEGVADFYCSYWSRGWIPTEIDYAYFFDRAVQMDVRQAKVDSAMTAVDRLETTIHRTMTPAERRRAISANFTAGNPTWTGDRLARDVAYYVDAIPIESLSNQSFSNLRDSKYAIGASAAGEITNWRARSGKRASDFGLSDERVAAPPRQMHAARPACKAPE